MHTQRFIAVATLAIVPIIVVVAGRQVFTNVTEDATHQIPGNTASEALGARGAGESIAPLEASLSAPSDTQPGLSRTDERLVAAGPADASEGRALPAGFRAEHDVVAAALAGGGGESGEIEGALPAQPGGAEGSVLAASPVDCDGDAAPAGCLAAAFEDEDGGLARVSGNDSTLTPGLARSSARNAAGSARSGSSGPAISSPRGGTAAEVGSAPSGGTGAGVGSAPSGGLPSSQPAVGDAPGADGRAPNADAPVEPLGIQAPRQIDGNPGNGQVEGNPGSGPIEGNPGSGQIEGNPGNSVLALSEGNPGNGVLALPQGAFEPSPARTPELGSLVLFGTGAAGIASYALARIRAGRKRQDPADSDPEI